MGSSGVEVDMGVWSRRERAEYPTGRYTSLAGSQLFTTVVSSTSLTLTS